MMSLAASGQPQNGLLLEKSSIASRIYSSPSFNEQYVSKGFRSFAPKIGSEYDYPRREST